MVAGLDFQSVEITSSGNGPAGNFTWYTANTIELHGRHRVWLLRYAIPNTVPNISPALDDTYFQYTSPTQISPATVTIPTGLFNISDLNTFLHQLMSDNGDDPSQLEIFVTGTFTQITAGIGYAIIIPATGIQTLTGFVAGTYAGPVGPSPAYTTYTSDNPTSIRFGFSSFQILITGLVRGSWSNTGQGKQGVLTSVVYSDSWKVSANFLQAYTVVTPRYAGVIPESTNAFSVQVCDQDGVVLDFNQGGTPGDPSSYTLNSTSFALQFERVGIMEDIMLSILEGFQKVMKFFKIQ